METPRIVKASSIARSKDPKSLIIEALERTGGVIFHTAHELGVNRETLRLWIVRLDLYPEVKRIRMEAKARRCSTYPPKVF